MGSRDEAVAVAGASRAKWLRAARHSNRQSGHDWLIGDTLVSLLECPLPTWCITWLLLICSTAAVAYFQWTAFVLATDLVLFVLFFV